MLDQNQYVLSASSQLGRVKMTDAVCAAISDCTKKVCGQRCTICTICAIFHMFRVLWQLVLLSSAQLAPNLK